MTLQSGAPVHASGCIGARSCSESSSTWSIAMLPDGCHEPDTRPRNWSAAPITRHRGVRGSGTWQVVGRGPAVGSGIRISGVTASRTARPGLINSRNASSKRCTGTTRTPGGLPITLEDPTAVERAVQQLRDCAFTLRIFLQWWKDLGKIQTGRRVRFLFDDNKLQPPPGP